MDKVVFIIPSTTKFVKTNQKYDTVDEIPLLNILYNSIKTHDISNYTFVVGIDDDDDFYLNNQGKIKEVLPSNFHLRFFNNFDKSYVCIVNQLANSAINDFEADYLYIYADDLVVYSLQHIPTFIDYFKKNNNLCLGWGLDEGASHTCSHPFVHKNHINIFNYFYPREIINWHCDDWIRDLYTKLDRIVKTDSFVIANQIGVRYNQHYIPPHQLAEIVNKTYDVILPFVNESTQN